jgi:hypothetical protein
LQRRTEFLDALFDIGAADLNVGFQVAVALGERRELFFGARQRGLARLQRLGHRIVALGERRARLLEILDLALARLVHRLDLGEPLLRVVASSLTADGTSGSVSISARNAGVPLRATLL